MPHFHYQALNAAQQLVAGKLEASSVAQAIVQLEAGGLVVQSIGFASAETSETGAAQSMIRPSAIVSLEQTSLQEHLARAIERARPLLPALHAFDAELPPGHYRRQLTKMLQIVERGDVQQAAADLERMPANWIALLAAASTSAEPVRILDQFLSEAQRADELRRQWWWTFAYPVTILIASIALIAFLSFVPIPIFREMFTSFGLRLPEATRLVLSVAESIRSGRILIVLLAIVAIGVLLVQTTRLLPLPLRNWFGDRFGTPLGRATAFAQFAQSLADLLEAELPTGTALRIAGFAAQSPRLQRASWGLARDVDAGGPIESTGYRRTITATVLYALGGDAPLGPRVHLIRQLGAAYADQADQSLSWTRGVIEPLAIVIVGTIVGFVVIALFLPLLSLIQALS
jgi:type IV pilus assembly protein PilC